MRVFLDTKVLVAAFATRGLCADLLRLVLAEHDLVVGVPVLEELRRVLRVRIRLPPEQIASVVDFLGPYVHEPTPAPVDLLGLADATDEPIVTAAIAAQVDVFVSGDKELLEEDLPLLAVSPRGLWEHLRKQPGSPDEVHETLPPLVPSP